MADTQEWSVDGYHFQTQKDAEQAQSELARIEKLEEKLDYNNAHMLYAVYTKALGTHIFKTQIGYEFLHKLQKKLKELPAQEESIEDIDLDTLYQLRDSTNPAVERIKASVKPKPKPPKPKKTKREISLRMSIGLNVILILLVAVMFYISMNGENATVLNYERVLQNRYATWEQELTEREAVVREKEIELLQDE